MSPAARPPFEQKCPRPRREALGLRTPFQRQLRHLPAPHPAGAHPPGTCLGPGGGGAAHLGRIPARVLNPLLPAARKHPGPGRGGSVRRCSPPPLPQTSSTGSRGALGGQPGRSRGAGAGGPGEGATSGGTGPALPPAPGTHIPEPGDAAAPTPPRVGAASARGPTAARCRGGVGGDGHDDRDREGSGRDGGGGGQQPLFACLLVCLFLNSIPGTKGESVRN